MSEFTLTAEVRWFWTGQSPEGLMNLIETDPKMLFQESRTDQYLIFPDSDYVGVKLRDGKFEIKSFVNHLGKLEWSPNLQAQKEMWQKWSLQSVDQIFSEKLMCESQNLEVKKNRTTCLLHQSNKGWQFAPTDSQVNQGCQIEVSDIEINNRNYWSFSLESFGKDDLLGKNLEQILNYLQQNKPLLKILNNKEFGEPKAVSYPVFLRNL